MIVHLRTLFFLFLMIAAAAPAVGGMIESESRLAFEIVGNDFQASKVSIETGIFTEFSREGQEMVDEFEAEGNFLNPAGAGSLSYPVFFSSSPLEGEFGAGYSSQYEENRIDLGLTSVTPGTNSFTLNNFSWGYDRKWTLEGGDPDPLSIGWYTGMSLRFVDNVQSTVLYEADIAFFSFIVENPDETETSFIESGLYEAAGLVPFSGTTYYVIEDGEIVGDPLSELNFDVELAADGDYTMYVAHYSDQFVNSVPTPGAAILFVLGLGSLLFRGRFSRA